MPEPAIEAYKSTLIERVLALTQTTPTDGPVRWWLDANELRFAFWAVLTKFSGVLAACS